MKFHVSMRVMVVIVANQNTMPKHTISERFSCFLYILTVSLIETIAVIGPFPFFFTFVYNHCYKQTIHRHQHRHSFDIKQHFRHFILTIQVLNHQFPSVTYSFERVFCVIQIQNLMNFRAI